MAMCPAFPLPLHLGCLPHERMRKWRPGLTPRHPGTHRNAQAACSVRAEELACRRAHALCMAGAMAPNASAMRREAAPLCALLKPFSIPPCHATAPHACVGRIASRLLLLAAVRHLGCGGRDRGAVQARPGPRPKLDSRSAAGEMRGQVSSSGMTCVPCEDGGILEVKAWLLSASPCQRVPPCMDNPTRCRLRVRLRLRQQQPLYDTPWLFRMARRPGHGMAHFKHLSHSHRPDLPCACAACPSLADPLRWQRHTTTHARAPCATCWAGPPMAAGGAPSALLCCRSQFTSRIAYAA